MTETYINVANELEDRIRRLDVGDKVPSENEVVREFSVSRPTARAALQELERRFVVRRVKGSGTFVNERIPYPIGSKYPPSASRTIALSGHEATLRVITVSEIEPSLAEISLFGHDAPQRLCVVGRTMEVDGEVAGFGVSKVSCSIAPGIRRHLADISSIWRILHSLYGIRLTRRAINVSIDTPPDHVARIIDSREPAWHLQSVNVDEVTGTVVELGESWIRTDRIAVSVHFDHPSDISDGDAFDLPPVLRPHRIQECLIMNRNRRTELLARADADDVRELAESFLSRRSVAEELQVINPPEVGMVMMQVREPVCKERFHLGEVVVTRAEVAVAGARGWAMRAGADRETALAAALLDACSEHDSSLAAEVHSLCERTASHLADDERREWDELRSTAVSFEELD